MCRVLFLSNSLSYFFCLSASAYLPLCQSAYLATAYLPFLLIHLSAYLPVHICLSAICLSDYLSGCLYDNLRICPSDSLSIFLSTYLSVCISACLHISLYAFLSVYAYLLDSLSAHPHLYLSAYIYSIRDICPSVYPPTCFANIFKLRSVVCFAEDSFASLFDICFMYLVWQPAYCPWSDEAARGFWFGLARWRAHFCELTALAHAWSPLSVQSSHGFNSSSQGTYIRSSCIRGNSRTRFIKRAYIMR